MLTKQELSVRRKITISEIEELIEGLGVLKMDLADACGVTYPTFSYHWDRAEKKEKEGKKGFFNEKHQAAIIQLFRDKYEEQENGGGKSKTRKKPAKKPDPETPEEASEPEPPAETTDEEDPEDQQEAWTPTPPEYQEEEKKQEAENQEAIQLSDGPEQMNTIVVKDSEEAEKPRKENRAEDSFRDNIIRFNQLLDEEATKLSLYMRYSREHGFHIEAADIEKKYKVVNDIRFALKSIIEDEVPADQVQIFLD